MVEVRETIIVAKAPGQNEILLEAVNYLPIKSRETWQAR